MPLLLRRAPWVSTLAPLLCGAAACFGSSSGGTAPAVDGGGLDSGFPDTSQGGDSGSLKDATGSADSQSPLDGSSHPDGASDAGGDGGTSAVLPAAATGNVFGAASAGGSAVVLVESVSFTPTVYFSHFEPGSGWSTAVELADVEATAPGTIRVRIDDAGNAWLAWYGRSDAGASLVMVDRYDHAAGTWGAIQTPDLASGTGGGEFAFDVGPGGDALLVAPHAAATLVGERYVAGTWTAETVATDAQAAIVTAPAIAVGPNGVDTAVYIANAGPVARFRSSAGAWAPVGQPLTGLEFTDSATAINAAGDILMGWQQAQGQASALFYDASTTTWTGPMAVSTTAEASSYPATLAAAISPSGDGVYAQGFNPGSKNQIESYTFTKSTKTWSAKAVMPATVDVHPASIAFDANLDGIAVWASLNGAPGISYDAYTAASGWAQPVLLDPGSEKGLAGFASSTGAAWAGWSGTTTGIVRVR